MRCNARCGFCDYWKTPPSAKARELRQLRRRGALLQSDARHASPAASRRCGAISRISSRRSTPGGAPQVHHAASRTAGCSRLERARSLWDAGINQFNISLDYLDERHDRRAGFPGSPRRSSTPCHGMRAARNRQRPVQHRDQERQPRSAHADRSARAQTLGVRRELQRLHRREERQRRALSERCAGGARGRTRARAARVQAETPRRHHELRLLSRADPALRARRDDASRVARVCARSTSIRRAT